MAETQRLFFAFWPPDGVRQRLAELVQQVGRVSRGRPVEAGNLHLTLSFLGHVAPAARLCLERLAAGVRGKPFLLTLDCFGYWARPQVLWLGSREVPPALADLAGQLNGGLAACGLQAEKRSYQPHLTLLRKVKPAGARAVREPGAVPPPALEWPIGGFVLAESLTHPQGVRYRVLESWTLAGRSLSK